MFYYLADVRFLDGRKTPSSKVYNYLVSYTVAQKILTALQYSDSTAFNIRTSIGDTYRDAKVVFTEFVPCDDYIGARRNYKEITQITPIAKATTPYCFNIADTRLKRMLDGDLYAYGTMTVRDNPEPRSRKTVAKTDMGCPPPPIGTGSTAAINMGGVVSDKSMWNLFEETQERESKVKNKGIYGRDALVQSIEDSIKELQGRNIISDNPKTSKTIFNMTVPDDSTIPVTISINPTKKEKSTMFDNIMKDMYFGPYRNKDVRLSMQGMAVKTPEGRYNAYNVQTGALTDVTGFLMDDFGDVFYALPVAQKDLKIGDVILHNKVPVIVTQIGSAYTSVIDPARGEELKKVPAKSMFGFDFYSKIMNIMEGLMGTANADQPFGMLPMLMLMQDNDNGSESNDLMKVMLMSQMMGANGNMQANPILMMALMGDKGGDNSMMKYFMMTEMMKQGGAGFGGMFGTQVSTPATSPTAKAPAVKVSRTDE